MEIHVREDRRIMEVWLTKREKQDESLQKRLNSICRQYREKRYLVAVFVSGNRDLTEETSALLCCSRRRLAEQEVRKTRVRAPGGAVAG